MLGIQNIASYVPKQRISNYKKADIFNIDDNFIENKLGIKAHSVKEKDEKSSDLCIKAFDNLTRKINIDLNVIDCCIVVTQNPDFNIPHTSAIVHGKLGLTNECPCFDISLGCSGYVYGLSNIISFMKDNGLTNGLLFTSDPYSEVVNKEDKDTSLIFGDAASVTYITNNSIYSPLDFSFGTDGSNYKELICKDTLYMNGRAVFNFAATTIPKHIQSLLVKNKINDSNIDKYILHQGSKYIVDTIRKRLKVNVEKVPFDIYEYGNTVSSSIPIILEKEIENNENNTIVLSGFGVGLSWASSIIKKVK